MAAELGPEYAVAVDGLTARATDLDDTKDWNAVKADMFNGARTLPAAIAREMPVDALVIALGTNDLKADTARSAEDIADGIVRVARVAQGCAGGVAYRYDAPKVLVVSPAPLAPMPHPAFADMFAGGEAKSAALGKALRIAADRAGIASFDAGAVTGPVEGVDGLHLGRMQHARLGKAIAAAVRAL